MFYFFNDQRVRIMLNTELDDNKFYYVNWKGYHWLKQNNLNIKHIYKDMVPATFQKRTVKKLKKLNPEIIKSFSSSNYSIPDFKISGILYRRDTILKNNNLKDN